MRSGGAAQHELLDAPWKRQRGTLQIVVLIDMALTIFQLPRECLIVLALVVAPFDGIAAEVLADASGH